MLPVLAATTNFNNPILWAILIGWILSVVLHEFAHGIVAYWGGDYTIAERGGLTLNPLQYVDPVMSILLPAVFLLMGGVPLPGGVTYVRRDLIRSTGWNIAVSAAGPAMNFLLFFAFALPLHPAFGWVDPAAMPDEWSNAQVFCGGMALLQLVAAMLNLLPIPPLDGFQIVAEFLDEDLRQRIMQMGLFLFFGLFLVLANVDFLNRAITPVLETLLETIGFDEWAIHGVKMAYNIALFGHS